MPVKEPNDEARLGRPGAVRHSGVMRGRPIVLHPILFAAYPVLFLFAQNAAEQVTLEIEELPVVVSASDPPGEFEPGRNGSSPA